MPKRDEDDSDQERAQKEGQESVLHGSGKEVGGHATGPGESMGAESRGREVGITEVRIW